MGRNRKSIRAVGVSVEARLLAVMPAVRGFLGRLVLTRPGLDADDLLQETMERALKYRSSWDPSLEARPWLQSIAFRVFLDARKRSIQGPRPLGELEVRSAPPSIDPAVIEQLLAGLEERDASVLTAFHLQSRSIAEIAAEYSVAEGTVKSWLHRARKRLAERLDPEAWL